MFLFLFFFHFHHIEESGLWQFPRVSTPPPSTPTRFTYFHEMVVQEERCRTMCPGYEDGLDGAVSIGLPVLLTLGFIVSKVLGPKSSKLRAF